MRAGLLGGLGTALALGCAQPAPCAPDAPPPVQPASLTDAEARKYFGKDAGRPGIGLNTEQRRFFGGSLLTLGASGSPSYRLIDPTHVVSDTALISIHHTVIETKRIVGQRVVTAKRRVEELTWYQIDWCLRRWFLTESPKLEEGEPTPLLIEGAEDAYRVAALPYPDIDDPLPERRGIAQCLRLMVRAAGGEFRSNQCQMR